MAKRIVGLDIDARGSGTVRGGQPKGRRSGNTSDEAANFPWTAGPQTRAQKIARALWG